MRELNLSVYPPPSHILAVASRIRQQASMSLPAPVRHDMYLHSNQETKCPQHIRTTHHEAPALLTKSEEQCRAQPLNIVRFLDMNRGCMLGFTDHLLAGGSGHVDVWMVRV